MKTAHNRMLPHAPGNFTFKGGLSGHKGVLAALASAFLFGAGTPLAKGLLEQVSPWMLAGLL